VCTFGLRSAVACLFLSPHTGHCVVCLRKREGNIHYDPGCRSFSPLDASFYPDSRLIQSFLRLISHRYISRHPISISRDIFFISQVLVPSRVTEQTLTHLVSAVLLRVSHHCIVRVPLSLPVYTRSCILSLSCNAIIALAPGVGRRFSSPKE
jgi:hypothetical protein